MESILQQTIEYITTMNPYEATGLIFGLLAVIFLIKENILTWPSGIIYVLVSLVVFWREKLYADFALHIFFLVLNIYGWWYWIKGSRALKTDASSDKAEVTEEVLITHTPVHTLIILILISIMGIFSMGYVLETFTDASLPYWDSATTMLSLVGMWLTARKQLENWHFWFIVDVLATGVYYYKGIHFYSILYLVYIGLAVSGYLTWRKAMKTQTSL
ncbi:nicotinamide mononucleotide transporter [Fulvivirga sp. 29W222]|uniref:Nicotinamide riboside transporter PnuC n=1 Tax=Fulvivirga marina TaxID=2494733 RepID=A0A937G7K9_9BACT|nr:nicotinamide riboside transporter PnuC [Fulvivirga marina]MBL6449891.1 nicotinamide mononucleotide transporter [Fulvivirga marina]